MLGGVKWRSSAGDSTVTDRRPIQTLTPVFQNGIKNPVMDVLMLSRIQFGATIAFHYIYPHDNSGKGEEAYHGCGGKKSAKQGMTR